MDTSTSRSNKSERLLQFKTDLLESGLFFLVFTVFLVAMYIWAIATVPDLRRLGRLIPFTLLAVVHTALYWVSPYVAQLRRLMLPYFVLQAAIVFVINLLVPNQGFLIGLYLGLAGLVVGILEDLRVALIPVAALLGLSVISYALTWGWESITGWLVFFGPMAVFVVVYVAMFTRESRARVRTQELLQDLEVAHQKLAEYAVQVEDLTLEAERQRMARELHDTLAQGLAGLILQLEAVEAHLVDGGEARALEVVGQAKARARAVLHDARSAIGDLREKRDLPGGLTEAIRMEVDRFSKSTGIPCELEVPAGFSVAAAQAEHILRLVSEGLANTAQHARARQAWVRLSFKGNELLVEVGDDGQGFNPQEAVVRPGHYGLVGLRERARLAGGRLEIASEPGVRSTLRLWLPRVVEAFDE